MADVNLENVVAELGKVAFGKADDANGSAMKYASKLKALEMLGRHLGLYEKQSGVDLAVKIVDDIGGAPDENEKAENGDFPKR